MSGFTIFLYIILLLLVISCCCLCCCLTCQEEREPIYSRDGSLIEEKVVVEHVVVEHHAPNYDPQHRNHYQPYHDTSDDE